MYFWAIRATRTIHSKPLYIPDKNTRRNYLLYTNGHEPVTLFQFLQFYFP